MYLAKLTAIYLDCLQLARLYCPSTGSKGEVWAEERGRLYKGIGGFYVTFIFHENFICMGRIHKDTLYIQCIKGEVTLWPNSFSLDLEW